LSHHSSVVDGPSRALARGGGGGGATRDRGVTSRASIADAALAEVVEGA